jgi:hypothetical protein
MRKRLYISLLDPLCWCVGASRRVGLGLESDFSSVRLALESLALYICTKTQRG